MNPVKCCISHNSRQIPSNQSICQRYTRVSLRQSFLKSSCSNARQIRRDLKLVVHVQAMTDTTLQSKAEWGFQKNAEISKFEANVRLVMYASMYSGILQVQGAEVAAKEIFDVCVETCDKIEYKTVNLYLQPLNTMNEYAAKLKKDTNLEGLSTQLQNACQYAQDSITHQQSVSDEVTESAPAIRFQSQSQKGVQSGLKIALFLSKLGGQLQAQGYETEANWLYQNVHQMERKIVQQKTMFMLSNPVHEVAKMLLKRTDDSDVGKIAKCIYGGAIEFWDSSFGPNHPDMYSMYVGLAEIILDLGECDDRPYNTQDRIQHLAEYIQQKHRGTGVLPDYYI
eukprot:TRINITY_DN897_c0_g1_i15.p1 TRINITY_DN897_c0_g1~~TRINITY_DN897_c0_g1_i15.p1  ORF type:complete len:339 (+),score=34.60 TRINITY_DN897_c0_g1_i15:97-1113(+)